MGTVTTMLWATNGTGDGVATGYTDVQTQRLFRSLLSSLPAGQGVIRGDGNELAVSNPSGSTIRVDTGAALVYGLFFYHDGSVTDLTPTTPAADTAGLVYAEIDWATQTGSININQATSGDTTVPSLTQTALTTWQIPLASYIIDSSGNIWTDTNKNIAGLTDLRQFIGHKAAGTRVLIEEQTLTSASAQVIFNNIPQHFNHLELRCFVGGDYVSAVAAKLALTINNNVTGVYYYGGDLTGAGDTDLEFGRFDAQGGRYSSYIVDFPFYTKTTRPRTIEGRGHYAVSGAATQYHVSGHYLAVENITRIDVLSPTASVNFQTTSTFQLYGVY